MKVNGEVTIDIIGSKNKGMNGTFEGATKPMYYVNLSGLHGQKHMLKAKVHFYDRPTMEGKQNSGGNS